MQIIAVTNQKGGCGKTITAVNLAGGLAAGGKKIFFIDLDPQSHGTCAFGMLENSPAKSSYQIFESFLNRSSVNLSSLAQQKYQNLWIVGSHISLSTVEQKMANIMGALLVLVNALKAEQTKFDYAIIDTPPNLGFLTLNALHAADRVIVPLDVSVFSLNGVSQLEDILELASGMGFKKPKVNFLITLFDGRSNFAKTFLEKAKERFGAHLMQSVIRQNVRLREAAQAGKIIFEYDPHSNGARDYTALIKEMAPEFKEETIRIKTSLPEAAAEKTEAFFKLYAPAAQNVYLTGSFNDWLTDEGSLMKKLDNGMWVKIISLPQGAYNYKFVVDGKWIEDPSNSHVEADAFGGKNSVVLVER